MRNNIFVGRKKEQEILKEALTSYEAEMVAVIGRRRVGKTYLIKFGEKTSLLARFPPLASNYP